MLKNVLLIVAAFATLTGCASYKLGSSGELRYSSIFVSPPRNQSTLPQLEGPLNAAIRKEIEGSNKLSVANQADADAILDVVVLKADRQIAAVLPSDVGRARKFEITFDVELSLRSNSQPDTYYIRDRAFTVTVDIFTDSGQVNAEHQSVSEVARKIALRTSEIIQDVW